MNTYLDLAFNRPMISYIFFWHRMCPGDHTREKRLCLCCGKKTVRKYSVEHLTSIKIDRKKRLLWKRLGEISQVKKIQLNFSVPLMQINLFSNRTPFCFFASFLYWNTRTVVRISKGNVLQYFFIMLQMQDNQFPWQYFLLWKLATHWGAKKKKSTELC